MSVCKGCGREIRWEKTHAGKNHPFDAKPTLVLVPGDGAFVAVSGHVSHFATCPNAKEFSKKGEVRDN